VIKSSKEREKLPMRASAVVQAWKKWWKWWNNPKQYCGESFYFQWSLQTFRLTFRVLLSAINYNLVIGLYLSLSMLKLCQK